MVAGVKDAQMRRRIVFAGLGALISGAAIVVALVTGPPSKRQVPPTEAEAVPSPPGAHSPSEGGEQPVVIQSRTGAPMLVGRRTDDGKVALALPAQPREPFAMKLPPGLTELWGKKPLWVHVAASWCLPCLWELEPLFDSAQRIVQSGAAPVVAIVDAEGDPERGMQQLLAKFERLPDAPKLTVPEGLIPVADDQRQFNAVVDTFFAGADRTLRKQGIPLSLLFDRCGRLVLVAQNRHNRATFALIEEAASRLVSEKNACR